MAKYSAGKKDTLKSLAEKYGVTRKRLRKLNEDIEFGKAKKKGGEGFKSLKGQEIRLGKGVGAPKWRSEILSDPTYAAFERQFEYNRGKLGSDFIALKNRLGRDLQRQQGIYDQQLIEGHRGVDETMDNRGLFRSGQRHLDRGRVKNNIDDQRQRFIDSQGETREEARRQKREGIADLKRQRGEQRLAARDRLTMKDAETKYGY